MATVVSILLFKRAKSVGDAFCGLPWQIHPLYSYQPHFLSTRLFWYDSFCHALVSVGCLLPARFGSELHHSPVLVFDDLSQINVSEVFKDILPIMEVRGPSQTAPIQLGKSELQWCRAVNSVVIQWKFETQRPAQHLDHVSHRWAAGPRILLPANKLLHTGNDGCLAQHWLAIGYSATPALGPSPARTRNQFVTSYTGTCTGSCCTAMVVACRVQTHRCTGLWSGSYVYGRDSMRDWQNWAFRMWCLARAISWTAQWKWINQRVSSGESTQIWAAFCVMCRTFICLWCHFS